MKTTPILLALAALAACSPKPAAEKTDAAAPAALPAPVTTPAPAGTYTLDHAHTSVTFRVDHMGISRYTARFTKADGELKFDPAKPEAMSVTAKVDPTSLKTDYTDAANYDFDATLEGKGWLEATNHPSITFASTKVERTGADTAKVTGDLSLHGVTQSIVLDVKFNGGYAPSAMDPAGSRIGFSAKGGFKRSAFGISQGIPAGGSKVGVGDDVEVIIETEFTRKADATN